MTWAEIDWEVLQRHRERFLGSGPADAPYWASPADLAAYDMTFGERIGWKWDAVLDELRLRGWSPPGGTVLDWGCGSGIAGRRVVGAFGPGGFGELRLWDHSEIAVRFAAEAARSRFPGLRVSPAARSYLHSPEPIGLLVVSHVMNELPEAALQELHGLIRRCAAVLWTEPGSRETSRALGLVRDRWAGEFRVVAPCTRAGACPVLAGGNERHWCHHFAPPPPAIFADPQWVRFGQRVGIDLRSLPYSFVALDRNWGGGQAGLSRVIGRPEHFKPYARLLSCDDDGLAELTLMKRGATELYKELERTRRPLVYRWSRSGDTILSGARGF